MNTLPLEADTRILIVGNLLEKIRTYFLNSRKQRKSVKSFMEKDLIMSYIRKKMINNHLL